MRPPEEIAQLMRFFAEKAKNVTSPLNVGELCRQFKEETGTSASLNALQKRVIANRHKIHEMNEFDMETKVKMIFALGASIDGDWLVELRRVADVKVDDQQRIIRYKQNDGGLELSGKHSRVPIKIGEQRNRDMILFLAEKSKTVDTPIGVKSFLKEFKANTACTDSIETLKQRYRRVKRTIYQSSEIDKNTKIRMMFTSNVKISDDILEELRKDADVEVDENGRITKYISKDGSFELEGSHEMSTTTKSYYSDRWHTACENVNEVVSEKDDEEDANYQKDFEKKRIDLIRFLIERTKNATAPLNIKQLARDYKADIQSSESPHTTRNRIRSFRPRIHKMNQFDNPTKVKLAFALSALIDAEFLKELQKDAIVELDESQKIKKYKAKDGSLELEGDHSRSAKAKERCAEMKKRRKVINDSSESEDDGDEENGSESDGSEEEDAPTSSSARRSDRLRKSRISLQNNNRKRQLSEKNSDSTYTRNHARMSREKKRARISYSSSGTSDEESPEEDDDEESEKSEDDIAMDFETEDMDHETTQEVEKGVPKKASMKNDENSEHINIGSKPAVDNVPAERKPESLIEVKTEVPEEPSGGENGLIEPKIEECTREVKQEAEEDEERPSTSSSTKIESMSLLELLNHFRSPIAQYTPTLVPIIDENIKKLEEKDKQIPFNIVFESLEMCIQLLNILEEMDSDENTTSLPNFFYRLGMAICNIKHPSVDDFYLKIKKLACTADKKVSLVHIRYVMGKTLDKILH